MNRDVMLAQAATLKEWAELWRREEDEGSGEMGWLVETVLEIPNVPHDLAHGLFRIMKVHDLSATHRSQETGHKLLLASLIKHGGVGIQMQQVPMVMEKCDTEAVKSTYRDPRCVRCAALRRDPLAEFLGGRVTERQH